MGVCPGPPVERAPAIATWPGGGHKATQIWLGSPSITQAEPKVITPGVESQAQLRGTGAAIMGRVKYELAL